MKIHLLAAYVVLSPAMAVAAFLVMYHSFGVAGRDMSPWPVVLLLVYCVTALVAVATLIRQKRTRTLAGWAGVLAVAVGLALFLIQIADGRLSSSDRLEVGIPAMVATAIGLLLLYWGFGNGLSLMKAAAKSGISGGIDWISITEASGEVRFEVRQRRLLRLVRWSVLLVLGLVCFGGIIGLFLVSPRYVSETAAGAIGFILLLGGVYFLFAAISGLFPALWALKEAGTARFAVTPYGIRQDGSEAARTIPFESASGPYYVDLQTRGTAQAPMNGAASMVYVGAGIGGVAAAGSIATAQAAGNLVGQGVRLGIEQVLRGSAGQVFIEDKAKKVFLARLLEDREARFLSEKLATAIQKMAPSGT